MFFTYLTLNYLGLDRVYILTCAFVLILSSLKHPNPNGMLQQVQRGLRVQYWTDKYQDRRERRDETHKLKAEEQYARWIAFKASRAIQFSQQHDCYILEDQQHPQIHFLTNFIYFLSLYFVFP